MIPLLGLLSCLALVVFVGVLITLAVMLMFSAIGGKAWPQKTLALAVPAMQPSQALGVPTGHAVLYVDEARQWLALVQKSGYCTVFRFCDIVRVELIEDGNSVTRTARGSQLAGAAMGELLFGSRGAMVGAMTGARVTQQLVQSVQVHITVDDMRNPLHVVEFLRRATYKTHPAARHALQAAHQWVAVLHVAIQRASRPAAGPPALPATTQS